MSEEQENTENTTVIKSADTEQNKALEAELNTLKQEAERLDIRFHPSIGLNTLKTKIENYKEEQRKLEAKLERKKKQEEQKRKQIEEEYNKKEKQVSVNAAPTVGANRETKFQKQQRQRRAANRLVRIRITCMNPNKKNWKGEIFTASNSVVGTIKKFVPFNAEEGWHVPQMIYNVIKDRKYQSFYSVPSTNGDSIKKSKLIPEFSVEELPPLTSKQLQDLAKVQAMRGSASE